MPVIPSRIGSFEVTRQIGSGGMGTVYLGWDPELNRPVAIKVIREEVHDDEVLDRFFHEARAAAALRHPNIITIYASGQHERQPYMVMEFIDGESLADIIRARHDIPLLHRLSFLEQLCAGLHFAHRAGIVHRDIKPANVMVDKEGIVRILDFGIARIEGSGLTHGGALIGSVNYMSPEQMLGRPIDHRSDIFSVGSVAYELISYQQAFKGGLNDGLLQRLPYEQPVPIGEICYGLPVGVEGVVERALQKAPEDRFQDLAEMRSAIIDIQQRVEAEQSSDSQGSQNTIMILREALQTSLSTDQPASPVTPSFATAPASAPDAAASEQSIGVFQLFDQIAHTPDTPPAPPSAPEVPSATMADPPGAPPAPAAPPSTWRWRQQAPGTSRPPSTLTRRPVRAAVPAPTPSNARKWMLVGSAAAVVVIGALAATPWLTGAPTADERERQAVYGAMEHFRTGHRNRSMDAVRAAFPSLSQEAQNTLQRAFRDCLLYDVTFDALSVALAAPDLNAARAEVRSTHTCTPQSGGRQVTTKHRDVYTLTKEDGRWVIGTVRELPVSRTDGRR